MNKEAFDKENVFGQGELNTAFAQYFIGNSYLNPLVDPKTSPLFLGNVTFEPGCRNNWHIHQATKNGGQILICTAGEGWYQEEGKAAVSLVPGTVIVIPANVKHWHGAKADSWFSHIAIEVPGENGSTYDPAAGERNPDEQALIYISSVAPNLGAGEKHTYAAGVLGICTNVRPCRNAPNGTFPQTGAKEQDCKRGVLYDYGIYFCLWLYGIYKAWISGIYVGKVSLCFL